MQLVWGMMNTLQLIGCTLKFNLILPSNLYLFFETINDFLNMKAKFLQDYMDKIIDKIVSTLDHDPKATKETNILKNLGFLLASLAALVFLVLLILTTSMFISRFPR